MKPDPYADIARMTRAEVAWWMGITRARVMQLEQSALRKLRKALEADL